MHEVKPVQLDVNLCRSSRYTYLQFQFFTVVLLIIPLWDSHHSFLAVSILLCVLIWSLESVLDTISGYEWGWGLLGKVKKYDPVSGGVWGLVNSLVSAINI